MRNNQDRIGDFKPEAAEAPVSNSLNFVTPTFLVDLPSKGRYYPQGHPLRGKESLEIREMTAKEEDILTSKNLITKNIVLDKLLESVIINKNIDNDQNN
jgi:hypothetical protein